MNDYDHGGRDKEQNHIWLFDPEKQMDVELQNMEGTVTATPSVFTAISRTCFITQSECSLSNFLYQSAIAANLLEIMVLFEIVFYFPQVKTSLTKMYSGFSNLCQYHFLYSSFKLISIDVQIHLGLIHIRNVAVINQTLRPPDLNHLDFSEIFRRCSGMQRLYANPDDLQLFEY